MHSRNRLPLAFLQELRPAFVAHLANRLDELICRETQIYSARAGLRAPVRTYSALLYLMKKGPATLTEIASVDGQSHQLVAARLGPLEKLGFIERTTDPKDARRRPFRLTRTGRAEARRVEEVTADIAKAMTELFDELGLDLMDVLDKALERLSASPFNLRIRSDSSIRKKAS